MTALLKSSARGVLWSKGVLGAADIVVAQVMILMQIAIVAQGITNFEFVMNPNCLTMGNGAKLRLQSFFRRRRDCKNAQRCVVDRVCPR